MRKAVLHRIAGRLETATTGPLPGQHVWVFASGKELTVVRTTRPTEGDDKDKEKEQDAPLAISLRRRPKPNIRWPTSKAAPWGPSATRGRIARRAALTSC